VSVGLAAAFATFIAIGLSMKNSSSHIAGIACSIIIQMLAVGLLTGAAHAFEEVHEMKYEAESPFVWGTEDIDPDTNNIVKVFGFFGLRGKFTAVEFAIWMGSIITLTILQVSAVSFVASYVYDELDTSSLLQVWHNVYGRSLNCFAGAFSPTSASGGGDIELEIQEEQDDQQIVKGTSENI